MTYSSTDLRALRSLPSMRAPSDLSGPSRIVPSHHPTHREAPDDRGWRRGWSPRPAADAPGSCTAGGGMVSSNHVEQRTPTCRFRSAPCSRSRRVPARRVPSSTRSGSRAVRSLCVEVHEQLVRLVDDLGDTGVGPVDLVDHQDHRHVGASRALRSTNRVCGSGPSAASTSKTIPSTIVSARSTSPPKSAWPGVSTMLSVTRRRPRSCTGPRCSSRGS